ncbi:hypothetical protein SBF1_1030014 [Candidatus Desulfosporosinus infrequens]|uniref:Uncharacterized protein n=1 Tax=Candidatus Desulfosporosinus infrequens TaxID=2043169 RepID=A0A2U3JWK7_9FIRM|nr:hypothetical protein SBF1_1030014 [Candidatus Desulfosporosinus infrequens]
MRDRSGGWAKARLKRNAMSISKPATIIEAKRISVLAKG